MRVHLQGQRVFEREAMKIYDLTIFLTSGKWFRHVEVLACGKIV
ncbi:MAG: hypothetical protein NTW78_03965 [Campylobacterales bacterium]|nr:hypothetical protein [Campylobacterales bacterium]